MTGTAAAAGTTERLRLPAMPYRSRFPSWEPAFLLRERAACAQAVLTGTRAWGRIVR